MSTARFLWFVALATLTGIFALGYVLNMPPQASWATGRWPTVQWDLWGVLFGALFALPVIDRVRRWVWA